MRRVLGRPALVLLGVVPLLVAAWLCYQRVGSGFMPSMDEGGFILDYRAPSGTSLSETDRLLRQVEAILQETPEVQTYFAPHGPAAGRRPDRGERGRLFCPVEAAAAPADRRGHGRRAREVEKKIPGLEIEMALLMEDLIGDLTAVPQPIEIKLYSDDAKLLETAAPAVAAVIGKIPGVVDVKDGIVLAGDALTINVDRAKAVLEGMDRTRSRRR